MPCLVNAGPPEREIAIKALANKRIAFTNYQDINQINKRASKLFYGHAKAFPPGGAAISDRYEKSTRNAYDALALDFDIAD